MILPSTPLALLFLALPTLLQALPILPPTELATIENPWVPVLALAAEPPLTKKHLRLRRLVSEDDVVAPPEGVEKRQRWVWAPDTEVN